MEGALAGARAARERDRCAAAGGVLTAGMGRKERTFHWEYTLDGKTFVSGGSTPISKVTIAGLPVMTMVGFRVSVTVSNNPQGPWSQVVSILVR